MIESICSGNVRRMKFIRPIEKSSCREPMQTSQKETLKAENVWKRPPWFPVNV